MERTIKHRTGQERFKRIMSSNERIESSMRMFLTLKMTMEVCLIHMMSKKTILIEKIRICRPLTISRSLTFPFNIDPLL